LVTSAHVYLRSDPSPVTEDPYGNGWLFEGWELPDSPAKNGLMSGAQALAWMEHELGRLDAFAHGLTTTHRQDVGTPVMNDGGHASPDLLSQLGREDTLRLLHTFFAPDRTWDEETRR
jgi:hypothetical protein